MSSNVRKRSRALPRERTRFIPRDERDWFYVEEVAEANWRSTKTVSRYCRDGTLQFDRPHSRAPMQIHADALRDAGLRVPGVEVDVSDRLESAIRTAVREGETWLDAGGAINSDSLATRLAELNSVTLRIRRQLRSRGVPVDNYNSPEDFKRAIERVPYAHRDKCREYVQRIEDGRPWPNPKIAAELRKAARIAGVELRLLPDD